MSQQIEHQNNFHFLRLMAASMVILGHVYPISGRGTFDFIQTWTNGVIPTAHLGVCIFFSVSGYLVTQSLENSSSGWSYLWKRSLRIFPGLIFSTLITIVFVGALATTLPLKQYFLNSDTWRYLSVIKLYPSYTDSLPQVFKTNPTTAVNGSLWTLAYEFTMYLVLMATFFLLIRYKKIILILSLLAFGGYFFMIPYFYENPLTFPIIHLQVATFIDFGIYFLSGVFYYLFRQNIVYKPSFVLIAVLALVISYVVANVMGWLPLQLVAWMRHLCVPYLVFFFAFQKNSFNQLGRYGDFSYGVYVFGYPIQQLIVLWLGPETSVAVLTLLCFVGVLPLAYMSWHGVEKPFMKFKNSLK